MLVIRANDVFKDVSDYLKYTYGNDPKYNNVVFVLGYMILDMNAIRKKYQSSKLIILQLEQIFPGSQWFNKQTIRGLRIADEIWEYDTQNRKYYEKYVTCYIRMYVFGYCKELEKVPIVESKDIDVLFYGHFSARRSQFLDALKSRTNVVVFQTNQIYGEALDAYIARAKIVLNLHANEVFIQEQVRLFYLLINSKCIVSEISPENHYGDMISEFETEDELIQIVNHLLTDDNWKRSEEKARLFNEMT